MTWMDPDPAAEARVHALDSLPVEDHALPNVLAFLRDDSWRVRRLAADKLARFEPTQALVDQLIALLGERGNTGGRNAAAAVLSQLGPLALPSLEALLRHADPDQRKFAADILGELRRPEIVPSLIRALADSDANVRAASAEALGRIGGTEALRALERLLETTDPLLRVCALEGFAIAGVSPALTALTPLLALPLTRRSAFRVLGFVRHPTASVLICQALRTPATRDAALVALGARTAPLPADVEDDVRACVPASPETTAWLVAALATDDRERRVGALHVAHALAAPELAPAVAEATGDGDTSPLALRVLLHLGPSGALTLIAGAPPPIVTLSRDARVVASEAVLQLAGPTFVEALGGLLRVGDPELADLAARALGRCACVAAIEPLASLFEDDALAVHAFRSLVALSQSFPQQVRQCLERVTARALQPHAVRALAQVAGAGGLAVLQRALNDEREAVRAAAAESCMFVTAEAPTLLANAVVDESPRVRRAVARAIAKLEPAAAQPVLARLLSDTDASVLALAAAAVGKLSARTHLPRLVTLAAALDPGVALAALQALALLGALDDDVASRALVHSDAEVVKQVLTLAADRAVVVAHAVGALEHPQWDVRVAAARALAVGGPRSALVQLHAAIEREPDALARELLVTAAGALAAR